MTNLNLQHWRLDVDAEGITWAVLDKAGESANSLSRAVMDELALVLDECERQPPKALIFSSGKSAGFIAGADIQEFTQLDSAEKGRELVERGWNLFNRLAAVRYPTLALVRGHCLGGGLELALACRYLLAVEESGTKMGLPEVMLGIFPGHKARSVKNLMEGSASIDDAVKAYVAAVKAKTFPAPEHGW